MNVASQRAANSEYRVVVGLGTTGLSCARFLLQSGLPFVVVDTRSVQNCYLIHRKAVVNTQQAKRTDERDVSPKHSAVAAIDGDAQTRPIIAGLPQAHSSLSWEQAIYQFPTENVAILDEDGQIISANNYWLATSE